VHEGSFGIWCAMLLQIAFVLNTNKNAFYLTEIDYISRWNYRCFWTVKLLTKLKKFNYHLKELFSIPLWGIGPTYCCVRVLNACYSFNLLSRRVVSNRTRHSRHDTNRLFVLLKCMGYSIFCSVFIICEGASRQNDFVRIQCVSLN